MVIIRLVICMAFGRERQISCANSMSITLNDVKGYTNSLLEA